MAHEIVHWEVMGPDGAALTGFYRDLFDWEPQSTPGFEGYNMVPPEQSGIGGAIGQGNDAMPNYVTFYVQVDGIDEYLGKVETGGGKTLVPRTVLPGMVTFALFADPAGNTVGLVESETPPGE